MSCLATYLKTDRMDMLGDFNMPRKRNVQVTSVKRIYYFFSDVTIHLDGHQLRGHRFIMSARGDSWTPAGQDLATVERLDFDGLSYAIGHTMLRWVGVLKQVLMLVYRQKSRM